MGRLGSYVKERGLGGLEPGSKVGRTGGRV